MAISFGPKKRYLQGIVTTVMDSHDDDSDGLVATIIDSHDDDSDDFVDTIDSHDDDSDVKSGITESYNDHYEETNEPVSTIRKDKPKSNIVKWLINQSDRSLEEIAESLDCTTSYLHKKFDIDSFSLDDIIIVARVCGYTITFNSNSPTDKKNSSFKINIKEYFEPINSDVLKRINKIEEKRKALKLEEYKMLKLKLKELEAEYGFKD